MVNLQQAKDYLRIDDTLDDVFIQTLIDTSLIYIDSCVTEGYKTNDKAVKLADLLQLKLIADMYKTRSCEIPSNTKRDRITTTILEKLSLYEVV